MAMLSSYRDLIVWQKAFDLSARVGRTVRSYPKEELYGLTKQTKEAAASVPANIAEGYGRASRKEYIQFLCIAHGSLCELETHLLMARAWQLTPPDTLDTLLRDADEVSRILKALIAKLRRPPSPGP